MEAINDEKALAVGRMRLMEPTIADLKDKRRKLIAKLCDSLHSIASEDAGYTADFDVTELDTAVRKLAALQRDLMSRVQAHNREAERADLTPIRVRPVHIT